MFMLLDSPLYQMKDKVELFNGEVVDLKHFRECIEEAFNSVPIKELLYPKDYPFNEYELQEIAILEKESQKHRGLSHFVRWCNSNHDLKDSKMNDRFFQDRSNADSSKRKMGSSSSEKPLDERQEISQFVTEQISSDNKSVSVHSKSSVVPSSPSQKSSKTPSGGYKKSK